MLPDMVVAADLPEDAYTQSAFERPFQRVSGTWQRAHSRSRCLSRARVIEGGSCLMPVDVRDTVSVTAPVKNIERPQTLSGTANTVRNAHPAMPPVFAATLRGASFASDLAGECFRPPPPPPPSFIPRSTGRLNSDWSIKISLVLGAGILTLRARRNGPTGNTRPRAHAIWPGGRPAATERHWNDSNPQTHPADVRVSGDMRRRPALVSACSISKFGTCKTSQIPLSFFGARVPSDVSDRTTAWLGKEGRP